MEAESKSVGNKQQEINLCKRKKKGWNKISYRFPTRSGPGCCFFFSHQLFFFSLWRIFHQRQRKALFRNSMVSSDFNFLVCTRLSMLRMCKLCKALALESDFEAFGFTYFREWKEDWENRNSVFRRRMLFYGLCFLSLPSLGNKGWQREGDFGACWGE